MMKQILSAVIALFIFTISYSSQNDTIYFDKDWKLSDSDNYKYYRTFKVNDSIIDIVDYYKNGTIQKIGSCKTTLDKLYNMIVENPIRQFTYFDRKGRTSYIQIFDIKNNHNLVSKVYEYPLDINNKSDSSLVFNIYYFRNGNIKSNGFTIDSCCAHFYWTDYSKKAKVKFVSKYDHGNFTQSIYYYKGYKTHIYNFCNGKKNGEFKNFYLYGGPIRIYGKFKNNKKHGEFIYYHENGDIE